MLWDSHDLGDHWTEVSDNRADQCPAFYFSRLFVAPNDEEQSLFPVVRHRAESKDGGKTAKVIGRGVHPDHHALWIDPQHPERMIKGNDGGVYISADAGQNWRYLDNIPIEQFYKVAADDHEPYRSAADCRTTTPGAVLRAAWAAGAMTGSDWWT